MSNWNKIFKPIVVLVIICKMCIRDRSSREVRLASTARILLLRQ